MIKKNKTAAQISDMIKAYENDPALSFAISREMGQLDLMKNSNNLIYEIGQKEKQVEQLKKEFIGYDKIRRRKDALRQQEIVAQGELLTAQEQAAKEEDYTFVLDSMLNRDKYDNHINVGPFEDIQQENKAYDEELAKLNEQIVINQKASAQS